MSHYGFTGTREPISTDHGLKLRLLISHLINVEGATVMHHGGCEGADRFLHEWWPSYVVIHPGDLGQELWARSQQRLDPGRILVLPVQPYLERNRVIVRRSSVLVAMPKSRQEELRSGTWATVRAARRARRPVWYVVPEQSVAPWKEENQ